MGHNRAKKLIFLIRLQFYLKLSDNGLFALDILDVPIALLDRELGK